jgi:hypothetical protein
MFSKVGKRKGSLWRHLGALLLYGLLAAVFTWPLVLNVDRANDHGDPAVMVWSMAWISHALFNSPASLYDANIFYPVEDALAYTDLLLPSALLDAPMYFATGNPLVGFNVILLLTFVLSGYTTFLLARRLLGGAPYTLPAAIFAGAIFAFSPYRMAHITQLNSMTTYFLPLILLFLHRYLEDGRRARDLLLAGFFFTLNAVSGLYYGVFAVLMVVIFYVLWYLLRRERPARWDFYYGIPVAMIFGSVLFLILQPYLALSGAADHSRSIETVDGGSVVAGALLSSPPESWLLGWTPDAFRVSHEYGKPLYELTLYPGLAAAFLALYGFLRRRSRDTALYALLGLAIFVFSLGPQVTVAGQKIPMPYLLLYELVPGFSNLRVPARMWAIVMLCVAVLAAFGLRLLLERLRGRRATLALAAVSLFALLEFAPALPKQGYAVENPPELPPAYTYLAENAPEETVVAEFPFASRNDPFRETPRMYRSAYGWWNLVNGYASYFPENYSERGKALSKFSTPQGEDVLKRLSVDYLILHPEDYREDGKNPQEMLEEADSAPYLERVTGDESGVLFRVEG